MRPQSVALAFMNHIIYRHTTPEVIFLDNGSEFNILFLTALYKFF